MLVRGELGSGKTTLVRGASRALGVSEPVTSPTFSIGHRYAGDGVTVSHLDLYRLAGLEREDPALLADYLGPGGSRSWSGPRTARRAAGARIRVTLSHRGGDRRRIDVDDLADAADGSMRTSKADGQADGDRTGAAAMNVLGFDTATPADRGRAAPGGRRYHEARDDRPPARTPGTRRGCSSMAAELLAEAGVAWSAIDRVAVGVGPGTFTGLRVGVATARGIAQSLSAALVGVSSLAGAARAARRSRRSPLRGRAAGRARRDRRPPRRGVRGRYEAGDTGEPRELAAARALPPRELASVLADAQEAPAVRAVAGGRRRGAALSRGARGRRASR